MIFREVYAGELQKSVEVLHSSYAKRAEQFSLTAGNCPTDSAFITLQRLIFETDNGLSLFCAEEAGEIVAVCGIERFERECRLTRLGVIPTKRCRGTGKALLKLSIEKARNWGYGELCCHVIDEDEYVKHWLLSEGFTTGEIRGYPTVPYIVCKCTYII